MKKKIKLEDLERKDIFTTPEGYFEKLPKRIHEKIGSPERKDEKAVYNLIPKKIYYIAASVAIFLIAAILVWHMSEKTASKQDILADVSTEAMIEYLEMSDISVTEITLAEDEQQQLLDNQWQDLVIPEDYASEITTEELEEYL